MPRKAGNHTVKARACFTPRGGIMASGGGCMSQPDHGPAGLRSLARGGTAGRTEASAAASRQSWSDEALMAAIATHDELAFAALYERWAELVYSTAIRVLADPGLAEDTTQDVFVRLWRRPETFIPARGRFHSWLLSVVRNRAVDEVRLRGRRQRREVASLGDPEEQDHQALAATVSDPISVAQVVEERTMVRSALAGLPMEQRRALELAYFSGMTQQEIALELHEPLGTVKTRMRLGMQKLRKALQDRI